MIKETQALTTNEQSEDPHLAPGFPLDDRRIDSGFGAGSVDSKSEAPTQR